MSKNSNIVLMSKAEGFCPQCKMAKKFLDEHNIPYEEIKVTADSPEFKQQFDVTGLRNMPIIFPNGLGNYNGVFTGFDVNKLRALA